MRNLVLVFSFFYAFAVLATDISIKMAAPPCPLYVASYFGAGSVLVDSFVLANGEAVWRCDQDVKEGIYYLAGGKDVGRFDFLIGKDQDFSIELARLDSKDARIVGAEESEVFLDYQRFVEDRQHSKDEKQYYTQAAFEASLSGSMLHLVLKAMLPPPAQRASNSLLVLKSDAIYHFNVSHFWDNYDLSDERLVNTPFFKPQVDHFLRQVLWQREDKILEGCLPILKKAEGQSEVLRVMVSSALAYALEGTVMGIDALAYEVIARYYLSGKMGPLSASQKQLLLDYVLHTVDCRVGQVAKEMRLDSWEPEKGEVSLYEVQAPYMIVLFWEPDCDYCKSLIPILKNRIYPKYKSLGLHIFAVNTQRDFKLWHDYIVGQQLFDWTHGYQAVGETDFMTAYGVQGTPTMYILDNEKRIVAKNVKVEFLDRMLERLFETGGIY